jgi:hypothetical protein
MPSGRVNGERRRTVNAAPMWQQELGFESLINVT